MTSLPKLDRFGFDGADALIVVPPACDLHAPSLGAHSIQACALAAGFDVRVFYANMHFASTIGVLPYMKVSSAFRGSFATERLFARTAFGVVALGGRAADMFTMARALGGPIANQVYCDVPSKSQELLGELPGLESQVPAWVERVGGELAALDVRVIGATTTFEQTAASIALLGSVKSLRPDAIAIIGGANCEGEMAEGIIALAPFIDHVFSGESETSFPAFLTALKRGEHPRDRVFKGHPCRNLDAIPLLDYDDYFSQRAAMLDPADEQLLEATALPYETSRGCWWGEKHHCTFCGLNGEGMAFRTRSVDRAIDDLRSLTGKYGTTRIMMTDNIMPHRFFSTFVPRLAEELPGLDIFYEQKANLSRDKLAALHEAGIDLIQPGIEALSTDLLKLMRKGVSGAQNLSLLRDARGLGIALVWNLLWGFPGDRRSHYEETLAVLPYLTHLQPPGGFWPVMIDRFSPHFEEPDQFGITNIRPLPGYRDYLPAGAPAEKIAYHFEGDFESESYLAPELLREIECAVESWRAAWSTRPTPELRVGEHHGAFLLIDTRGLPGTNDFDVLTDEDAARLCASRRYDAGEGQRRLIERKLALHLDDWFVPLAVIDWRSFELIGLRSAGAAVARQAAEPAAVPAVAV